MNITIVLNDITVNINETLIIITFNYINFFKKKIKIVLNGSFKLNFQSSSPECLDSKYIRNIL